MRMKNEITALRQQLNVTAENFAQTALDAVPFVCLAQHFAHG
jgi:hypothetical protein